MPLNHRLDAAPVGTAEDRRRARQEFDGPWARAHRVRTVASVLGATVLLVALAVSVPA